MDGLVSKSALEQANRLFGLPESIGHGRQHKIDRPAISETLVFSD